MDLRWMEQTEADIPAGDSWLGPYEAAVLAALRFPKRRADWRLGRWTAKRAIAACLAGAGDFTKIEIRAGPDGAPEAVYGGRADAFTISISHRSGVACCAVARGAAALGCDLEAIEPRSAAFVADYFTDGEQALIAWAPAAGRDRLVTLLWSAKESAMKALRTGLRMDTRGVTVHPKTLFGRPGTWHALRVQHPDGAFHGWWRFEGTLVRTVVCSPQPGMPQAG